MKGNNDNLRKMFVSKRHKQLELNDKEHHGGPCIPGSQRLFVDVDGNLYPCERVSEESEVMRIGSLDEGFDYNKIYDILNFGKLTEENCKNCWAFRYCSLCAAYADDLDTLSANKKMKNCNNVRSILENQLKDYCMLNEFGYEFEDSDLIKVMED